MDSVVRICHSRCRQKLLLLRYCIDLWPTAPDHNVADNRQTRKHLESGFLRCKVHSNYNDDKNPFPAGHGLPESFPLLPSSAVTDSHRLSDSLPVPESLPYQESLSSHSGWNIHSGVPEFRLRWLLLPVVSYQ